MTATTEPDLAHAKVYDPEETLEEQAKRLLRASMLLFMERSRKLRKRVQLYVRRLPDEDRQALVRFLRREMELTIALIEDVEDDLPEFSFPSDYDYS